SKQGKVEKRDQRRTFAAGRDIRWTKVRNHGNAQARGNHRRFARLPGAGYLASAIVRGLPLVVNRLAVAADKIELACAGGSLGTQYRVSIELAEQKIQARKVSHAGVAGVHGAEHGGAHSFRIGDVFMGQHLKAQAEIRALLPGDADQGHVNAVGRSSTHDARYNHAGTSGWECGLSCGAVSSEKRF